MGKLDLLRKIIREEVRTVFKEELGEILKEAVLSNRNQNMITESPRVNAPLPGTLNNKPPKPTAPMLKSGNPLNAILQETAAAMTPEDYYGLAEGVRPNIDVPTVNSVDDMYAAARKSSNLEAIQINAVPDFTAVMAKMEANGEI